MSYLFLIPILVVAALLLVLVVWLPAGLIFTAYITGVRVNILSIIGVKLRKVDPEPLIRVMIKAKQSGIGKITVKQLEEHQVAGGDFDRVIDSLIYVKNAGTTFNTPKEKNEISKLLSFDRVAAMDKVKVNPIEIVHELIKARKEGLEDVTADKLEEHFLKGGQITEVIEALIIAKNAQIAQNIPSSYEAPPNPELVFNIINPQEQNETSYSIPQWLNFEKAASLQLSGIDVLKILKAAVNPMPITKKVENLTADGIQVTVTAGITVRPNFDYLVGGIKENIIQDRLGGAIVAAIGSVKIADLNNNVIEEHILKAQVTLGSAFEEMSIDISDIDIGENKGAENEKRDAEAKLKVTQAKAEEAIANARIKEEENAAKARADELRYKAEIQRMRAELVKAEAEVPLALAQALRNGNMTPEQYLRYKNMEADTEMRRSFSINISEENTDNQDDTKNK